MGEYLNTKTQASNYSVQAMQARTQGDVARRQAYANAYKLEFDSAQNGFIEGERMMTARQNAVAGLAAARNGQSGSGFAFSGSKLRGEQSMAEVLDAAIANMGRSYAIADQGARWQAAEYRKEGDVAQGLANVQAGYYDRMASISRKVAPWQLLGGALNVGSGILNTYNLFGSSDAATVARSAAGGVTGRQRY